MINEQSRVNSRKINLINLDDGYRPPTTAEQVRISFTSLAVHHARGDRS
jgi:hypothetical protein